MKFEYMWHYIVLLLLLLLYNDDCKIIYPPFYFPPHPFIHTQTRKHTCVLANAMKSTHLCIHILISGHFHTCLIQSSGIKLWCVCVPPRCGSSRQVWDQRSHSRRGTKQPDQVPVVGVVSLGTATNELRGVSSAAWTLKSITGSNAHWAAPAIDSYGKDRKKQLGSITSFALSSTGTQQSKGWHRATKKYIGKQLKMKKW